ncbi:MAG: alginate export family protein [Bacteroidota bacterium]
MKKGYLLLTLVILSVQLGMAQFTFDGEFRPRSEYRHGFGQVIGEDQDPGYSISTRARLNAKYAAETFVVYLSLQDVLTWGENRQIRIVDDNNSFAVFQAWASLKLGGGFSTKLGRQVISYDDQRIFGGLAWAQQARNHDAALLQYKKGKFLFDLGLAFNQDFDSQTGNVSGFTNVGNGFTESPGFFTYKTMQYLYLKQKWEKFSGSLLFLNNGFQNFEDPERTIADGVSNLQTFGTHLEYKSGSFDLAFNGFLQTGERVNELEVSSAYLLGLDLGYKVSDKVKLGIGTEIISGDDGQTAGETSAFFPLYGTNHKFNGYMDYFYVGNHANSVGLFDLHASANFKLDKTSNLFVKVLNFQGEQDTSSGESQLGSEIDLVFNKNLKDGMNLKIGYSQFFTGDGIFDIPQGSIGSDAEGDFQNWAWVMLTIKPKFFTTAKPD